MSNLDLTDDLEYVNARYFGGAAHEVTIGWHRAVKPPRKRLYEGYYDPARKRISVSRALDQDWIPRWYVRYVIYHELLHHFYPDDNGPNPHPPEFLAKERTHPHYQKALQWQQKHLKRLLSSPRMLGTNARGARRTLH